MEHISGGLQLAGASTKSFAFDNERPAHRAWLEPFRLAIRAVTNGEYRAFIEDDGYRRSEHWLADGWRVVTERGWRAPLSLEEVRNAARTLARAVQTCRDPDSEGADFALRPPREK